MLIKCTVCSPEHLARHAKPVPSTPNKAYVVAAPHFPLHPAATEFINCLRPAHPPPSCDAHATSSSPCSPVICLPFAWLLCHAARMLHHFRERRLHLLPAAGRWRLADGPPCGTMARCASMARFGGAWPAEPSAISLTNLHSSMAAANRFQRSTASPSGCSSTKQGTVSTSYASICRGEEDRFDERAQAPHHTHSTQDGVPLQAATRIRGRAHLGRPHLVQLRIDGRHLQGAAAQRAAAGHLQTSGNQLGWNTKLLEPWMQDCSSGLPPG